MKLWLSAYKIVFLDKVFVVRKTVNNHWKYCSMLNSCYRTKTGTGTSLVVQWLRLCAYNAGSPGLSPGLGTRSCMLQLKILCAAMKTEDPTCHQDLVQPNYGDPMDCSLPGSSVHGIFQAKVLEWVAISFSRGSSWPRAASIANRRFTTWATREAQINIKKNKNKKNNNPGTIPRESILLSWITNCLWIFLIGCVFHWSSNHETMSRFSTDPMNHKIPMWISGTNLYTWIISYVIWTSHLSVG